MKRGGFTPIELLALIAIILIVCAVLIPVFAQGKATARKSACLTHFKDIGLAVLMYLGDSNGVYPQKHPTSDNPAIDDSVRQLEKIDYGSPLLSIVPYVSSRYVDLDQIYYCPADPDPHGMRLLTRSGLCKGTTGPVRAPGFLTSIVLNAYYLFGISQSEISSPNQSVYVNERNDAVCDEQYRPWLGEVGDALGAPYTEPLPEAPGLGIPVFAIAATRHVMGSNGGFCDGRAHWSTFGKMRKPFVGHTLYGEFQAF